MNKKISLLAFTAVLAMPIVPAFAQVETSTERGQMRAELKTQRQENQVDREEMKGQIQANKATMQAKRLEFQDKKEAMTQERCKNLETKIATRTTRYQNNGSMLDKVYGNMQTRLSRLVAKIKTAGADTTKLEADLTILATKIATLKTTQATFMTALQETQAAACGKSEGEFKGKMDQARKVPAEIQAARKDIKTFFQTTIKTDLQAIRKTLAEKKEVAAPATTTTTVPAEAVPTL